MKIADALERYLVQLEANGRSIHTRMQCRRHGTLLARYFSEREINEIGHEDLARFFAGKEVTCTPDGRPKTGSSTNALRSSVRTFFGFVHAAGYVRANPARLLRRARTGIAPPRCLSAEEERRFFEVLDAGQGFEAERDRVLFRTMRETGVRISSALALEVGDVDLDEGVLLLRCFKGDRVEHAFLPQAMAEPLRDWIAKRVRGALFPSRHGHPLSSRQAARRFALWWKLAGNTRRASGHALRHSFATALYQRTGDVLLVKEALCHRSVASTMVYTTCDRHRVRRAIDNRVGLGLGR